MRQRLTPQHFLGCMIQLLNCRWGSPSLLRFRNYLGGPEDAVVQAREEALPEEAKEDAALVEEVEEDAVRVEEVDEDAARAADAALEINRDKMPSEEFLSLVRAARDLLAEKNFGVASDFAVALQHHMSHSPQHGTEVERFARMAIRDETPVTSDIVVEMRQHLVMLLCRLLKSYEIDHLRRRARQFAYQVSSRVLRQLFPRESVLSGAPRPASTEAHDLLSPELQASFLNYCVTQDEEMHFERKTPQKPSRG